MIFSYIVVGVEHTGDVLRQISVQNSLDVIANVNWRQMRGTLIQTDVIYISLSCFLNSAEGETAAVELFRKRFLQGAHVAALPSYSVEN